MLTIITGTPGAGKSLYAVWEECRKVPGSTIEASNGVAVPRRLLTNIRDLLVEHEKIDAEWLERWHLECKPGDVIVFDEVQEVWRPRALGQKVPDCIAKLETHRHMGVDIILITQHPMLVDPNIRRLCNRHLHLRRLAKQWAYVYEWDHCSNPGQTKTALQGRVWRHPPKAYGLYKSAQLHTKPTARIPKVALFLAAAVAGLAYVGPMAYGRLTERLSPPPDAKALALAPKPASSPPRPSGGPPAGPASAPKHAASEPAVAGCASARGVCRCYDTNAKRVTMPADYCEGQTQPGDVQLTTVNLASEQARRVDHDAAADVDVIEWMAQRGKRAVR